jgi:hypothetical protein
MAFVGLAVGSMALSVCSGSLGSSSDSSGAAAATTITYLVDNGETTVKTATALVAAYNALNTGVTVKLDTRPAGTDADNAVKTKLATGDMAEVFAYNPGFLLAALDPAKNQVPLTNEPYIAGRRSATAGTTFMARPTADTIQELLGSGGFSDACDDDYTAFYEYGPDELDMCVTDATPWIGTQDHDPADGFATLLWDQQQA